MKIVQRSDEVRIEQEWSHERPALDIPLTGFVYASVYSGGINLTATGTLPLEGIQALKDVIAVAEIIYRNGLD